MAIWHKRIASGITKATYTLRICHTYCFSVAIMVTRTCRNVMFVFVSLVINSGENYADTGM